MFEGDNLVDELLAERDTALAQLDSEEIHQGRKTAFVRHRRASRRPSGPTHNAAAADPKALKHQRNLSLV